MTKKHINLTELAAAAKASGCTVHLHHDQSRRLVFTVINPDLKTTEYRSYLQTLFELQEEGKKQEDRAERAGTVLAENVLKVIQKSGNKAENVGALEAALMDLQRLPHPKRAAGGFAGALVAHLELALSHV